MRTPLALPRELCSLRPCVRQRRQITSTLIFADGGSLLLEPATARPAHHRDREMLIRDSGCRVRPHRLGFYRCRTRPRSLLLGCPGCTAGSLGDRTGLRDVRRGCCTQGRAHPLLHRAGLGIPRELTPVLVLMRDFGTTHRRRFRLRGYLAVPGPRAGCHRAFDRFRELSGRRQCIAILVCALRARPVADWAVEAQHQQKGREESGKISASTAHRRGTHLTIIGTSCSPTFRCHGCVPALPPAAAGVGALRLASIGTTMGVSNTESRRGPVALIRHPTTRVSWAVRCRWHSGRKLALAARSPTRALSVRSGGGAMLSSSPLTTHFGNKKRSPGLF